MRTGKALLFTAGALAAVILAAGCSSPALTGIKVHIQNGEYEDAVHVADSVIARGEDQNADIWLWRGRALGSLRDYGGAAESFIRAWELDSSKSAEFEEFWWVFYNVAANLLSDGDVDGAREMLQNGKQVLPDRPEYDQLLGDIALNLGEIEVALAHFESSVTISLDRIAELEQMMQGASSEALVALGDMKADAEATALLSLYNAGMLHKSLALTGPEEEMTSHLEAAEEVLFQALELDPVNADVLSGIADIYLLGERFDEAFELFEQAMAGIEAGVAEGWLTEEEANAMRGQIALTRGIAKVEMDDFEGASADLELATSLLGPVYDVLATKAHANFMMDNFEEAIATLDRIVDEILDISGEELANTHYMRHACFARLERDEEALEAILLAVDQAPENADYWEFLAAAYSRLGRRSEAVEAMEMAESLRD